MHRNTEPQPDHTGAAPAVHLIPHGNGRYAPGRVLFGYALAAVLCVATLLVRLAIGYAPGDPPMLVLYMIPVMASAYAGGMGPGLFCSAFASFLAAYCLLEPTGNLLITNTNDLLNVATMLLTGVVISLLVESLHRLRRLSEVNQERYRIVADNTYDWEFWINPQGVSLYQSPSCLRITGHDAAEFLADPDTLEHIVHPDDLAQFKAHRHGVVSEKSRGELHFRIVRPDGEVRWIEHYCLPVFGRDGTYLGARGSNSDITARKRMEEVMVLTEKMMTVGGLAAGMAHEINNPLAGILQSHQNIERRISLDLPANLRVAQEQGCSLEALRNYLEARQVFDLLDVIEECGHKAARIVGNMLEFSRTDETGKILSDVNALAENAISLCAANYALRTTCNFNKIIIEREFDPSGPLVSCVPSQIEQVLVNLLTNAAQALKDRQPDAPPPLITIRTSSEAGVVRVEVTDNGPGMEPEVLKHAFDPFFSTKEPGQGAGLGLSVAYYIVTNHKGALSVESAPGQGARFTMELPG